MSIKEAVRIAQSNNFMGLVCNSRLLVSVLFPSSQQHAINNQYQNLVPALIDAIKTAGLVLVTDTSDGTSAHRISFRMPEGVDGILKSNGVLRFNETIDM